MALNMKVSPPPKKLERVFFPDIPIVKVGEECFNLLHDMCETLIVRICKAPEHFWYEAPAADDLKHVVTDGKATVEKSVGAFMKLLNRDTLQLDDLKFVKAATTAVSAKVLLLETYTWTALCLLGYVLGLTIGSGVLVKWLIGSMLLRINALVCAAIVPFYLHSRLRKAHWPEDEQRSVAFYASVLFGAFGSYAIGTPNSFAQWSPIVMLWIGTVSGYLEFQDMFRLGYLCASVGVPYLLYLVYAAFAFERFPLYSFAWTILCAVIAVDMQLKLGRLKRRWAGKELEQWESNAVIMVTHFVLSQLLTLMGSNKVNVTPK